MPCRAVLCRANAHILIRMTHTLFIHTHTHTLIHRTVATFSGTYIEYLFCAAIAVYSTLLCITENLRNECHIPTCLLREREKETRVNQMYTQNIFFRYLFKIFFHIFVLFLPYYYLILLLLPRPLNRNNSTYWNNVCVLVTIYLSIYSILSPNWINELKFVCTPNEPASIEQK